MATISGTGISLSSNYYLRNFYNSNSDARTSTKRKEMSNGTLSQADANALHQACKRLKNFNYSDETTDGANIYGSATAFVETYNNAMNSSTASSDSSLKRYASYLKNLSRDFEDELEDIGITMNSDGTLSASDNLLKNADISNVAKIFSKDSEYSSKVMRYAKRMISKAEEVLYSEKTKAANEQKSLIQSASVPAVAALDLDALLNTGIGSNINLIL